MTIYKKDGSIYKFSEPNKIMIQQNLWDNYITHNLNYLSQYILMAEEKSFYPNVLDLTTKIKKITESQINVNKFINQEKVKLEVENDQNKENEQIINTKPVQQNESDTKSKFKKTIAHCLIAKIKERTDDLYGDINRKVDYSDAFTVEIIVVEAQDLKLKVFTTYQNFSMDTILYPKDTEKRWWQIVNITPNPKGYFLECIPSKLQPSFSMK
jgi:restriction endonuclease Mrr